MKPLFVICFLSFTLANAFLLRIPTPETTSLSDSAPACITEYFTAFFAHFGLEKPNQIIQCFDEKTAAVYFKHLYEVTKLAQDSEKRDHTQVHLDWLKLIALHKVLKPLHGCIGSTQDFTDLLNIFGAKERNPELFWVAKYIYYQANFGKLAQELPQVTDALNHKDWKTAGDLAAGIVNTTVNDLKTQGLALNALNGLWNGVHIGLDLPDAQSVWSCWQNETAAVRLQFIYGLATAATHGKWNEAAANTEKWYKETGNDLVKKIPDSVWKCWAESSDTKAESDKLKVDITNPAFYEKVSKFVHSHQAAYWYIQKGIKDSLHDHNFLHAGNGYAHLLKAAASTK